MARQADQQPRLTPEEYRRLVGLPCTATIKGVRAPLLQRATFRIPGILPLSVNALFSSYIDKATGKVKRAKSKEYKAFIQALSLALAPQIEGDLDPEITYQATLYIYDRWLTKAGKFKKRDADNTLKAVLDVLAKLQGLDDRNFMYPRPYPIHSTKTKGMIIEISPKELQTGDM